MPETMRETIPEMSIATAHNIEQRALKLLEALEGGLKAASRETRLEALRVALDFEYQVGLDHARSFADKAKTLSRDQAPAGTPWRNGDTWHCRCGAANTQESCTNCQRKRCDEWGDVP